LVLFCKEELLAFVSYYSSRLADVHWRQKAFDPHKLQIGGIKQAHCFGGQGPCDVCAHNCQHRVDWRAFIIGEQVDIAGGEQVAFC